MEETPRHRLYVAPALAEGVEVAADDGQAHYLLHVLRLGEGAAIALFNGRDGEWRARLAVPAKRKAVLKVETRLRPQKPEPDLWLLFAPVKRARIDTIVEKATELGVSALQPVLTERTVMTRIGEDRLALIAAEAAEQCERLSVPELRPAKPLSAVLSVWPQGRLLLTMDETGQGRPIGEILGGFPQGPAAVLVGPEGGFTKTELDALTRLDFAVRAGLGSRILRADTAVIAALSCYQALCGDWRDPT